MRRVRSKVDRRQNMLRLTKKGAQMHAALLEHVERHERRVFARLTGTEQKKLMELLKRVGPPQGSARDAG